MVETATTHARPQLNPDLAVVRTLLPPAAIVPDPRNRRIVEDDDLDALCESIRVLGVLLPLQVVLRSDGMHCLIDGERRWRGGSASGLTPGPTPGEAKVSLRICWRKSVEAPGIEARPPCGFSSPLEAFRCQMPMILG